MGRLLSNIEFMAVDCFSNALAIACDGYASGSTQYSKPFLHRLELLTSFLSVLLVFILFLFGLCGINFLVQECFSLSGNRNCSAGHSSTALITILVRQLIVSAFMLTQLRPGI